MPILEYRCANCEAVSEEIVLAGDVASTPFCPKCGAQEMSRLLSRFAAGSSHGASADLGGCETPQDCGTAGACGMGMGGGCGSDFGGDF